MPFILGLMFFAFAVYCLGCVRNGLRTGEMQVVSRNVIPIFFFRKFEPILFWGAAVFNIFLALTCLVGTAIVILQELSEK